MPLRHFQLPLDHEFRREERFKFDLPGRYRNGTGRAHQVLFLDVSEYGCRFCDPCGSLSKGDTVSVRMGSIGPLAATVKWRDRRFVGVEFNQPLYLPVLYSMVMERSGLL
jgi:hypothetical protein